MDLSRLPPLVALAGVMFVAVAACSDQAPAPETPMPSPSPVDLPELTLGSEIPFPDGVAFLLETGCFQCDGLATGLARVYRDPSGLVRHELLVSSGAHVYRGQGGDESGYFAGDIPIPRETFETAKGPQQYDPYVTGIAVSGDSSEMIVSICVYPGCGIGMDAWSADGRVNLYRSTDAGVTWSDHGAAPGGAAVGLVAPGRALMVRYTGGDPAPVFFAPDGDPVNRPDTATGILLVPSVLADGAIAWPDRDGTLKRPDGTLILKLPELTGLNGPFSIGWVVQQPFGGRLIAVHWAANEPGSAGYITLFTAGGAEVETYSTGVRFLLAGAWVSDAVLAANVGIEADELASETPLFFPGLLPALIDLESREIHPIAEYFLEDGAEMGRNYVRGVQHLTAR